MTTAFRYQKLTLWWALFILVMCNMALGKVSHAPLFFPGFDKLVHCGFFFVLTVLANYGSIKQSGNLTFSAAVKAFTVAVVFGGIIELLQLYIFTWRSGEWNDLFADTVGVSMATFSSFMILKAFSNEKI
jgi:VanZ family protein